MEKKPTPPLDVLVDKAKRHFPKLTRAVFKLKSPQGVKPEQYINIVKQRILDHGSYGVKEKNEKGLYHIHKQNDVIGHMKELHDGSVELSLYRPEHAKQFKAHMIPYLNIF